MNKEINRILQLYVGRHLPSQHIFVPSEERPKAPVELTRLYFRKWLVHPLKRRLSHVYSEALSLGGCEIIGVTGSAGKTTAKEMIASVLSQKFKTVKSEANIDPVYNIPTTILKSPLNTQKLVLEMGIEYPGEMDFYLWLTRPQIGVITSIYFTHTQFLESLENVIRQKGKLVESLPSRGFAILNYDDPYVRSLAGKSRAREMWYGFGKRAQVRGRQVKITEDYNTSFILDTQEGEVAVELPLLGEHFVSLALAASCVGLACGVGLGDIKKGLEAVKGLPHRMIPFKTRGAVLIDDTFNANPLACREALNTLSKLAKGKRNIFVLGEMKELGKYEESLHREIGEYASRVGVDYIFGLGDLTRFTIEEFKKEGRRKGNTFLAEDKASLIHKLRGFINKGDAILVKGSRFMMMEEVVDSLV